MQRTYRAGLIFIFITLFLDILGIGIIVPVLPQLVAQLTGGDISHASPYFGLLMAVYSLMQFIFAPVLGALSDRFGRRPVLLLSLLGSAIDYLLLAWAPTFAWLLAARMISGLTGANITVGMAYIADVSPPEKRAQSFGLVGAAFGLGFTLGPALGGLLGHWDLRWPFLAAALLTALNMAYGFFVLPESHPPENRRPFAWSNANPAGALHLLRRYPVAAGLAICLLLAGLAQHSLQSVWVLYTTYRFQWDALANGMSLAAVGIGSAIVQGGLIRRVIPRLGEARTAYLGLGLSALAFLLFGLANQGWMMYPIILISSLGGMAGPASQGLVSQLYRTEEQGAIQGAVSSLATLTRVVAPLIATYLFGYFTSAAPVRIPGIPFFLGALLLLGAMAVCRSVLAHRPQLESRQEAVG